MYAAADKNPVIMKSEEMTYQITGTLDHKISSVDFKLEQNYPNPFNPSTKIRFSIPSEAKTSLIVYDILGKEITVLLNRDLSIGDYEVEFNGANLPSGIYFYKLTSGKYTEIRKMLLVK